MVIECITFICFIFFLVFLALFLCSTSSKMAKTTGIACCISLIGMMVFIGIADLKERDKEDIYTTVVTTSSGNRVKFTDTETNKTYYIDIIKETK